MTTIDTMVRAVSLPDARESYEFLWREVSAALVASKDIRRTLYFDAFLKSARLILAKLEEKGDYTPELWASYCGLIGHCVLSFGTVEVPKLLQLFHGVTQAVLRFPSRPQGLLADYEECVKAQREQFELSFLRQCQRRMPNGGSDGASVSAADTSGGSSIPPAPPTKVTAPRHPEIEFEYPHNAAAPHISKRDILKILNDMPIRMCFAHSSGILHMKLTNPLEIPQCNFVTTGYSCDTCRLKGLHVAYQAMLYDSEYDEEEAAATGLDASVSQSPSLSTQTKSSAEVRSDAQIAKKKFHGFDVCTACAAYFFLEQKKNFIKCVQSHTGGFALGTATGVNIRKALYRSAPLHADKSPGHCGTVAAGQGSPASDAAVATPVTCGTSRSTAEGTPGHPAATHRDVNSEGLTHSSSSSGGFASPASPPSRRGSRQASVLDLSLADAGQRLSSSPLPTAGPPPSLQAQAAAPPTAPNTRVSPPPLSAPVAATQARPARIHLTVSIAPYGARPIAWVLPDAAATSSEADPAEYPMQELLPPRAWKERCHYRSDKAYKQRPASPRVSLKASKIDSVLATLKSVPSSSSSGSPGPAWTGRSAKAGPDPDDEPGSALSLSATVRPGASSRMLILCKSSDSDESGSEADDGDSLSLGTSFETTTISTNKSASPSTAESAKEDVCAICLNTLAGEVPVIETKCHHFFHVECIEGFVNMSENNCPLCRHPDALPEMTVHSALADNTFRVTVTLTPAEAAQESVTVCVGALVGRNGAFENIMSVSAARCITVRSVERKKKRDSAAAAAVGLSAASSPSLGRPLPKAHTPTVTPAAAAQSSPSVPPGARAGRTMIRKTRPKTKPADPTPHLPVAPAKATKSPPR